MSNIHRYRHSCQSPRCRCHGSTTSLAPGRPAQAAVRPRRDCPASHFAPRAKQLSQDLNILDEGSPAPRTDSSRRSSYRTPIQTIARLQLANCRLDPRVTPPCLAEFHSGLLLLTLSLNVAWLGQARLLYEFHQLALILRRMKASIERRTSDSTVQSLFCLLHLLHQDLAVLRPSRQDRIVAHEARTILDHQDAVAELERLRNFTTYDQLSVRLEQTEEFFAVVDPFPLEHTPSSQVTDMNGHV